ncbi:hypothetical protein KVV02_001337 [Mortierella alpina]|uniref:Uncharacterized protein n=1 Tax=Mortierella alpina TaxID=64518 RepID=A0A9P8A2T3_MORAP|nr:hypothetical protein KVV02_001337 [Mortierella alpina]
MTQLNAKMRHGQTFPIQHHHLATILPYTSYYIESWHNSFKKRFFKDKLQRYDTVVYTLVQTAIPHYQQMCNRHSVQSRRMSPGARETLKANLLASNYMEQKRARS